MIHFFSIISIFFNVFFIGGNDSKQPIKDPIDICEKSYPEVDDDVTKITVNQLNAIKKHTDCIQVEGYVIHIYKCPPCPPNASCRPCNSPHFYIYTDPVTDRIAGVKANVYQTIVDADKTCQFKKNKKYTFTIERTVSKFEDTGKRTILYGNRLQAYTIDE